MINENLNITKFYSMIDKNLNLNRSAAVPEVGWQVEFKFIEFEVTINQDQQQHLWEVGNGKHLVKKVLS